MQLKRRLAVIPPRPVEAWILAGILFSAGAIVGAIHAGLIGPGAPQPRLDLAPVLDPTFETPSSRALAFAFAPGSAGPLVLMGLALALIYLAVEALVRRAFEHAHPFAAALPVAAVLSSAAWGGALRFTRFEGVITGAVAAGSAVLLIVRPGLVRATLGGLAAGVAAGLHPVWAGMLLAVPCLVPGTGGKPEIRGRVCAGLVAVAVAAGLWSTLVGPASGGPPPVALGARVSHAVQDLLAFPVYVLVPWRRYDVPTGFYPLLTSVPLILGGLVHAIVFGAGMMISGIRRGAVTAAVIAVGAVATAVLVRRQVPGNALTLLPLALYLLPLVGVTLSVLRGRVATSIQQGLLLALILIAVNVAWNRAAYFSSMGAVVDFPRQIDPLSRGDVFAPNLEEDPARLVLFAVTAPRTEPYAGAVIDRALSLLDQGKPALQPQHLRTLAEDRGRMAGRSVQRSPEFHKLVADVTRDLEIVQRLLADNTRLNFAQAGTALAESVPRVLDMFYNWGREMETVEKLQQFRRLAESVIPVASRAGYFETSVVLREAMQHLNPPDPEADAVLGMHRVFTGDVDGGRAAIAQALTKTKKGTVVAELSRGVFGVTSLRRGDADAAMRDLSQAWNALAAGGVQSVSYNVHSESFDFYVVAEIALARYEAARSVDTALVPQAARDLTELLKSPLSFGVRRVPALGMMGRLNLLQGNREAGLALLREARSLKAESIDDRGDGPRGRLDFPRYRRMVLEWLRDALTDEAERHEKAEVETELASVEK